MWHLPSFIKRHYLVKTVISVNHRLRRIFFPIQPLHNYVAFFSNQPRECEFLCHNIGSDEWWDWSGEGKDERICISLASRRSHNHMFTRECMQCARFLETHSPWRLAPSCRHLRRCFPTHAELVVDAAQWARDECVHSSLVSVHKLVASYIFYFYFFGAWGAVVAVVDVFASVCNKLMSPS